jgi:ParB-like chromosome segregation protein Spo0J
MAAVTEAWENRIVGYDEVAPANLLANPRNWRIHPRQQRKALETMLDTIGWMRPVIVNRDSGYVVDGHLRVALAIDRSEPVVPVTYVELSEDEERAVLAMHDPLAELALVDNDDWKALLAQAGADELVELLSLEQSEAEPALHGEFDEADEAERVRRQHELVCPYCGTEFEWDGNTETDDESVD